VNGKNLDILILQVVRSELSEGSLFRVNLGGPGHSSRFRDLFGLLIVTTLSRNATIKKKPDHLSFFQTSAGM
jgi:hypothetical protein